MEGTIFRERCESRTTGLQALADKVIADHLDVQFYYAVQEFVDEIRDHQGFLFEIWRKSLQAAVSGEMNDEELAEFQQFILQIFDRSIQQMETANRLIKESTVKGHPIQGESDFKSKHAEIRKIRHRIRTNWPAPDPAAMEKSLKEVREGKFKTIEELIDDLQGEAVRERH